SIAASSNAVLAACRVAGPTHTIDQVDVNARLATQLPTLGIFNNDINIDTRVTASANGSSILVAEADGTVLLYDANAGTFTASRKDQSKLGGAFAASSYGQYVAGSSLLNSSLVTVATLETGTGSPSGFAFVDQVGLRTMAADSASPGVIERVDLTQGLASNATRMVEAPVLPAADSAFTRTLAPLYNRSAIVNLTVSGFTVLPWAFDASVAPPRISSVVNAADLTQPVAPGGLITIFGQQLSPVNAASQEIPLPTALGNSCLTVNGQPIPILFVSPAQVNAQLPFQASGSVTLILRTPGGVSDNYNRVILPTAPSVFHSGVAGPLTNVPTLVRADNNLLVTDANPIHTGDSLVIYLTGLGQTNPAQDAGQPAPSSPLANALVQPTVTINGVSLPVVYAGLSPGEVGVYQINVNVPKSVPAGLDDTLTITQGATSTSLTVRVVQ
ncbi:MAG: IPT/TIG domain-containing protein, partial [Bryobacteraceae bacterium]